MKYTRTLRILAVVLSGMGMMLQTTSCISIDTLEFLQTAFLGVTAAASYAILRNI